MQEGLQQKATEFAEAVTQVNPIQKASEFAEVVTKVNPIQKASEFAEVITKVNPLQKASELTDTVSKVSPIVEDVISQVKHQAKSIASSLKPKEKFDPPETSDFAELGALDADELKYGILNLLINLKKNHFILLIFLLLLRKLDISPFVLVMVLDVMRILCLK